jgi:FlaA1/EpsC-like NDP-sugar epimerase
MDGWRIDSGSPEDAVCCNAIDRCTPGHAISRSTPPRSRHHTGDSKSNNTSQQGKRIQGVRLLGTIADLPRIIEATSPDDVLIAMPSAPPAVIRETVHKPQPFDVHVSTLPYLRDIAGGRVTLGQIRQLTIGDLMARPPVNLDPAPVRALIAGRRIMVTGAGGSIGSELCRQIAAFEPKALLLFERYENTLFAVANELQDR